MILSDIDIKKYIESGDITIAPFNEELLKSGSYTFTLGDLLTIPKSVGIINANMPPTEYEMVSIGQAGYVVEPGAFILGQTKEKLSISTKLSCLLDARTSLARIGLNVLQGSTFIQPGQSESNETLEIKNISNNPIRIYADMKIVKGIFMLLSSSSEQNYGESGRYAKQSRPME